MTLMARYSSICSECGGRWQPGDLIRSDGGVLRHAHCPDDYDQMVGLRPGETVCTTCWLVHPDGVCDR